MHSLLLASRSASRRALLDAAKIPYVLYEHAIDERAISWAMPLEQLVLAIARQKMEAVVYNDSQSNQDSPLFILTADTLTQQYDGTICGKPSSYEEAVAMLDGFRGKESRIATGFRIERRIWKQGKWYVEAAHEEVVVGICVFSVPESSVKEYLRQCSALSCAGAMAIEEYGLQFTQYVSGSYSSIIGLPLFEVRVALDEMGFFQTPKI
jgi:septum formation protein